MALRRILPLLMAACFAGCECGSGHLPNPDDYDAGTDAGTDAGDGGHDDPCGVDCSGFKAPPCMVSVCNTGQVPGPLNTCTIVAAKDGTLCDDGKFCTVDDFCDQGACVGGAQNDCGAGHDPCSSVICYEDTQSCSSTPADDGTACTASGKCVVDGMCVVGACVGLPKDCSGSPLTECNTVACDPGTGLCVGTPAPDQDGNPCLLSGDLCNVDKACLGGQCVGGTPKDCSSLDVGCTAGVCDPTSGGCEQGYAPAGLACSNGLACQQGTCNAKGECVGSTAPDGSACNDHDACTQGDVCTAGVCAGTPVAGCTEYLKEGFETCPDGWTLMGDWKCGVPTPPSPVTPFDGQGVLATQLDGAYHNDQTFAACTADSPSIDLSQAVSPTVFFWAWSSCEPNDGWNLKVSTDGGLSFQPVATVTPPYPLTIASQPAFGGDLSASGWQPYAADLTAWAKQSIILRFAFASDISVVGPGVYIDDVVVAEPNAIPLTITTTSPLADAYVGKAYATTLAKVGGTSGATWSLAGGVNDGWLTLLPNGVLTGTPTAAQVGPVSVTVDIQEPTLPSNFDEQTFTFNVIPDVYYTSFEGICPDGWTLLGDWSCGAPMSVGPATAYDGGQCIGTGLGTGYSDDDTWATTTATSPDIDLAGVLSPILTFRMWVDTEGGMNDGANLQISDNGGTSYAVLNTVTPAYPLMIGGEPAWGGHQSALGWQPVQVDLTAYSGKTVRLRFAFQSDASLTFAGVYIDDFLVQ
jgi:hypothetical protein